MIGSMVTLTADTGCDWLKQQKRFTAVLAFCFGWKKQFQKVETGLFQFCFSFISTVQTVLIACHSLQLSNIATIDLSIQTLVSDNKNKHAGLKLYDDFTISWWW